MAQSQKTSFFHRNRKISHITLYAKPFITWVHVLSRLMEDLLISCVHWEWFSVRQKDTWINDRIRGWHWSLAMLGTMHKTGITQHHDLNFLWLFILTTFNWLNASVDLIYSVFNGNTRRKKTWLKSSFSRWAAIKTSRESNWCTHRSNSQWSNNISYVHLIRVE